MAESMTPTYPENDYAHRQGWEFTLVIVVLLTFVLADESPRHVACCGWAEPETAPFQGLESVTSKTYIQGPG